MTGPTSEQGASYPATHWTQVFQARDLDKTCGRNALGQLLSRYQVALLRHLQWRFEATPEQAEDWLQSFVEKKILERQLMHHADRERGRFRNFLLSALDRFVWDEIKHAQAQKRKPAKGFVPLDDSPEAAIATTATSSDPGDVEWARGVLERAIRQTRQWYASGGSSITWEVFKLARVRPMLGGSTRPSDHEISQRCGLPADKISNTVNNAARKFRTELRTIVAEYATSETEIEAELRGLIETLRRAG
jgi:DNA-directed RNA polymerase specialized sigma24 family protein